MKTYKIKEFARNIGVTEKTLRYYEKFKIVEPSVDESNGYRSYNYRDAERIVASKRFSNMEFSIKEISKLLNETTIEEVTEKFRIQSPNLEEKARRLNVIAGRMRELEEELEWFRKSPNQGFLHQGKEWWFIRHVKDAEFVQDEESLSIVRKMMDALPCSVKMMRLPLEPEKSINLFWGLAIEPHYAEAMGICFQAPMEKIAAARCFYYPAVVTCKKERILRGGKDTPRIWQCMKKELEKKHLSATAAPYMIGSIDSFSGDTREKHFLYCVPVGD